MEPFWKTKSLEEMTHEEWESLCDGCSLCCLHKIEDEMTDKIHYTKIVCHYMDQETCRCTCYEERSVNVPTCVKMTPDRAHEFEWLPVTCAYRLLKENKELKSWHHLVSGSWETVHEAGISVKGKCVSETEVELEYFEDYEDYIIDDKH